MKPFLYVLVTISLLVPGAGVFAAALPEVRCPAQPKENRGYNLIFFSFHKKSAHLGTYIPDHLVLVDPIYLDAGPRCLTKQTYDAFLLMNAALHADLQQTLLVSSAWRSTETQNYFAKTRGDFAASPGRSEHQLGTTMDLAISGAKEENFGNSGVYQWMLVHAREYGFVQSFNSEGEKQTGIPNEPWHWRFVGKTIATRVTIEKLDINAYLHLRAQLKKAATR